MKDDSSNSNNIFKILTFILHIHITLINYFEMYQIVNNKIYLVHKLRTKLD